MNKVVYRHFKNRHKKVHLHGLEMMNVALSAGMGVIEGNLTLSELPINTICGIIKEKKHFKTLTLGISRSVPNDTFCKNKGRVYSQWRAINSPTVTMEFPLSTENDRIYGFFYNSAENVNSMYITEKNIRSLATIPDEILIPDVKTVREKIKWSEDQVNEARRIAQETDAVGAN